MNAVLTAGSSGRVDNTRHRAKAHSKEGLKMHHIKTAILAAGLLTAFATIGAQAQVAAVPGAKIPPAATGGECAYNAFLEPLVRSGEIAAIGREQQIWLTPVCEDELERNNYGTLFRDGNVETLRGVIAKNPALMGTLSAKGYDQFDVVALRFGQDETVNLFVHQRDMR
jgi:hypothetical protein